MALLTLQELMVHDLRDLYSAETQIESALPTMRDVARSDALRSLLGEYAAGVRDHLVRLLALFERLQRDPEGKRCRAIEALLEADRALVRQEAEPTVMDAALIGALCRMQHYKIAGYRIVETHARTLGDAKLTAELNRLRADEETADRQLIAVGQRINAQAPEA